MSHAVFSLPVRVYYEDTDAGGIVYYANYLKFMERARTEWLRDLGYEQDELSREHQVIFAVRSAQVEYIKPARFNDMLTITVALKRLGAVSMIFTQTIHCRDELLCSGEIKIACIHNQSLTPHPIPKAAYARIQAWRGE